MSKPISSHSFNVSSGINIHCRCENTRYGFRHVARLLQTGETAKVCYYNRTWERFEFQSVLFDLASKVGGRIGEEIRAYAEGYQEDASDLRAIGLVAALGDMLTGSKKESNDWKTRMLRAGLEDRGLDIPQDWDELSEDEKERRLNAAIGSLNE